MEFCNRKSEKKKHQTSTKNISLLANLPDGAKGAGLFQRAGQTMKQAGAKGTSRYLIGIKS